MRLLCRAAAASLALLAAFLQPAGCQEAPPPPDVLVQNADASYLKGDYEAARQALLTAWDALQQMPPEAPMRYQVLKRLTSVRTAAGEYADADAYLQKAIEWLQGNAGPNDPRVADDLLVSVALCRGMKDYERAFSLFARILAIHTRARGFDSAAVANDYSRMAQVLMDQKEQEDAASALETGIGIRTRVAGPLDASLLPDLDRLGEIQISLRAYGKAEATYRHALVARETLVGREHSDLLATLDGLAYSLFGQSRFEEAEPLYDRLLALWVKSAGGDHPMIAVTLDKIANFYNAQKKYEKADEAEARATAVRARFLADGLSTQAAIFTERGQTDQARAFYERVVKVLDPVDPMNADLRLSAEQALAQMVPKPAKPPAKSPARPPAGKTPVKK